jgi:hypothetical protein
VEANRRAHQLSARALGQRATVASSGFEVLAAGWVLADDEALLLKSQLGTFTRPEDMDLTGFEATHNHIHLDPDEPDPSERLRLWASTLALLYDGLRGATAAANVRRCIGIASLGEAGQGATVRWHLDRGERWLSDDLESFAHEAVLVIASEDLADEQLTWAS